MTNNLTELLTTAPNLYEGTFSISVKERYLSVQMLLEPYQQVKADIIKGKTSCAYHAFRNAKSITD